MNAQEKEERFALVKKPWQFYQEQFNGFLNHNAETMQGPLVSFFVVYDSNENILWDCHGPKEEAIKILEVMVNHLKGSIKC